MQCARARSVGACPNAADSPEEVRCYPPHRSENCGLYEPRRPTRGGHWPQRSSMSAFNAPRNSSISRR
eukprot:11174582-Lingulodinium_polyedra.AAC.1